MNYECDEDLQDIQKKLEEIDSRMTALNSKLRNLEKISKLLKEKRSEPFVNEIVGRVKMDDKFFGEFINFITRNQKKREVLLAILKRDLLNGCKNLEFI